MVQDRCRRTLFFTAFSILIGENCEVTVHSPSYNSNSCSSLQAIEKKIDEVLENGDFSEESLKRLMGSVRGDVANSVAKHKSLHG